MWLVKCLKGSVSENASTVNVLTVPNTAEISEIFYPIAPLFLDELIGKMSLLDI